MYEADRVKSTEWGRAPRGGYGAFTLALAYMYRLVSNFFRKHLKFEGGYYKFTQLPDIMKSS